MEKAPIDILWVAICAGLVFTMQAGFMCLEAGVTRRKNNINVAMKNLTDFGVSTLVFWLVGYGMVIGAHINAALANPVPDSLKAPTIVDELTEARWLDT